MNDNDIIKALECCVDQMNCRKCPLYVPGDGDCVDIVKIRALAIINRQNAEIEKLQRKLDCCIEENTFLRRYIGIHEERSISQIIADYKGIIATAQDEAIKEFVDRLCEGRVSNDPVVIAAKVELEERKEKKEE